VIKTFISTPLAELWATGHSAKIGAQFKKRLLVRLDRLNVCVAPEEMNLPGFNFHPLHGASQRFSVHVNGPWRLTFEFEGGDAVRVNFEQYH
jgi:proteic killer suppression protein